MVLFEAPVQETDIAGSAADKVSHRYGPSVQDTVRMSSLSELIPGRNRMPESVTMS